MTPSDDPAPPRPTLRALEALRERLWHDLDDVVDWIEATHRVAGVRVLASRRRGCDRRRLADVVAYVGREENVELSVQAARALAAIGYEVGVAVEPDDLVDAVSGVEPDRTNHRRMEACAKIQAALAAPGREPT